MRSFYTEKGLLKDGTFVDDYEYRIWNCDKSGFCLGVTSKKVLARKGSRSVHEVGGASDHQYITVNVVGNAAGICLPPFILICTTRGRKVARLVRITVSHSQGGWRKRTF